MAILKTGFVRSTDDVSQADGELVAALRESGGNAIAIKKAVLGRAAADVTRACKLLLLHDWSYAETVLTIGEVTGIRGPVRLALKEITEYPGRYRAELVNKATEYERSPDDPR